MGDGAFAYRKINVLYIRTVVKRHNEEEEKKKPAFTGSLKYCRVVLTLGYGARLPEQPRDVCLYIV